MHKKVKSSYFLIIPFILFYSCQTEKISKQIPAASNGILDLTEWNFDEDGPVYLKGEWEFYINQLLSPAELNNNRNLQKTYLVAPGSWNKIIDKSGQPSSLWCGTYRLFVNINQGRELHALYLNYILSASRVFVDGKELCSAGLVSQQREKTRPVLKVQKRAFACSADQIEIVIQVSNFHHRNGGLVTPLLLGRDDQLTALHEKNLFIDTLFFGSIFFMGLYYFFIFFMRKKDKSSLFFSGICIFFSLRIALVGEKIITQVFPRINAILLLKLEYSAVMMVLIFFNILYNSFYPAKYSTYLVKAMNIIYSIFIIIYIVTPPIFFTKWVVLLQLSIIMTCVYVNYEIIKAIIIKKEIESFILLIGAIIAFIFVLIDIYYTYNPISTRANSTIGLFIYFFLQGIHISGRFSKVFKKAEYLSQNLKIEVEKKTNQLKTQFERQKRFYINFAHETKTPLTLISNYMDSFLKEVQANRKLQVVKKNKNDS